MTQDIDRGAEQRRQALSENELRATAFFAIGLSSEGGFGGSSPPQWKMISFLESMWQRAILAGSFQCLPKWRA
jgi:hypothetical protein